MIYLYFALGFVLILAFICRDRNFYKLIMIFGKKGSGKTSYIAKKSLYYLKRGYKVYTNCYVAGTYQYDPRDIGLTTFPPGSVVFCDEVGLIWHNRDYKNFKKCVIEWFKLQRQYKIRMYLFSQAFDTDKVLRDLTDQIYICRRLGLLSVLRPVYKKIGITKDAEGQGQLVDCYDYGSIFSCEITYLPRYYCFFESFNPPDLPEINAFYQELDDFQALAQSTSKWLLFKVRALFLSLISFIKSKIQNKVDKR